MTIGGLSLLDNSTTLANGAVMYLVFTPFAEREKAGLDQHTILADVRRRVAGVQSAIIFPLIPPGHSRGSASRAASRCSSSCRAAAPTSTCSRPRPCR